MQPVRSRSVKEKSMFKRKWLGLALVAAAGLPALVGPAQATTGWGCFRVINVIQGDVLNLRAQPSARSAIVDRLVPGRHGIIAERGACTPAGAKPSQQWCPLRHYNGDRTTEGWARLVYLAPNQCP